MSRWEQSAAEPTPKRSLLIVSKTTHTLAIVDPATLAGVASSDGKTAYVSNTGSLR
ncbi:hypothetical protein [Hyalangium minutum]|uniref:Uncharacterized protein n=1 Tax=Hyalangium minutum TaxID=394096 RepID=A0A085W9T2_9BACT|nr:hypothetical protein [Hyalangium minutum]KFE64445.1 hypothetical protein DB31_2239 [Hyalangium minutum]